MGAFFKSGQTPQSESGSTSTAYFLLSILDDKSTHTYKKSEGILVNLRNGNTEMVLPGETIKAYRYVNQAWQLVGSFTLPETNSTITL